jgi:hypothetical protein
VLNRGLNRFAGPALPGGFPWSERIHAAGAAALRPPAAPANRGLFWFSTDASGGTLYRSTGTAWVQVAPAVSIAGAIDINGLTAADPALDDQLLGYDTSAAGNRKFQVDRLFGLPTFTPGGRLTLISGDAPATSDSTGATTLYYTPHLSDRIALYDGTRWKLYTFTERSLALSGLTSGQAYDVFLFDNAGTLTLELSVRGFAGVTIALTDGRYVRTDDTKRLYLGTIYTTGTNSCADSASQRFVWNMHNRIAKPLRAVDTTNTWTYASAAWRYANNTSANRAEMVIGLAHEAVEVSVLGTAQVDNAKAGGYGVGVDSNTVNSAQVMAESSTSDTGTNICHGHAQYRGWPGIGYHYLAWLEYARAGTVTFSGDLGLVTIQSGLSGTIWC